MSLKSSPDGANAPFLDPSQEANARSPSILSEALLAINNNRPHSRLLPKPGMNVPIQVLPSSAKDLESNQDTYIPPNPTDLRLPLTTIRKIMRAALPAEAMITRKAQEDMERYVVEFIQFLTNEAAENARNIHRKTLDGADIIEAMERTGFENYAEALRPYLEGYRAEKRDKATVSEAGEEDFSQTALEEEKALQ